MHDLLSSPVGEDFFCLNVFKPPRSGDGSLREEFPQAGLGGSPIVPQREAKQRKQSGSEAKPDGRLIRQSPIAIAPHRSPY